MKIHIWQALHDTETRREMEKESLEQMIRIYCHGKHRARKGQLCPEIP